MNEQKIVTAAIKKARKNGYRLPEVYEKIFDELDHGYCRMTELWWEGKGYYGIIFDPKFARALWGKKETKRTILIGVLSPSVSSTEPNDEYHLQGMVLAEDKAKYLKDFL